MKNPANEEHGKHERDQQTQAGHRPGQRAISGVHPQQDESCEDENHRSGHENVDEPFPDGACVPPFVQIVEIGDPAAIGQFIDQRAGFPVNRQPGIPAGARHGQISFGRGPFRLARGHIDVQPIGNILTHRIGDGGRVTIGKHPQRRQQGAVQLAGLFDGDRAAFNLAGVVQREAGDGKHQQRHQRYGRTDPVPAVKLAHPIAALAGFPGPRRLALSYLVRRRLGARHRRLLPFGRRSEGSDTINHKSKRSTARKFAQPRYCEWIAISQR